MNYIGKILFPIFFVSLIYPYDIQAQKNEIGIGAGVFNYTGEVSPRFSFKFSRPGGNLFYRRNFSPVVSLRASIFMGMIQADESKSDKAVPEVRQADFSGLITEASAMIEYNFFNYRANKELRRYSPYLTGGLGFFNSPAGAIQLAVPMGVGIKYKLTEQLNLGLEFVARKTYTDELDGISDDVIGRKLIADPLDKDWYYYTGITLSYTFFSVICPEFH